MESPGRIPQGARAQALRRASTDAERRLWFHLRARRIQGWKFRRQHPIGSCIVDFVCLERKLVIELDGSQHMDAREQDVARDAFLAKRGYLVLRFWNNEVLLETGAVLERIRTTALLRRPSPQPSPTGVGEGAD